MHSLRTLKKINSLFNQVTFDTSKVVSSFAEAVKGIQNGAKVLVGGYGVCGVPNELIQAVQASGVTGLTVYSSNAGVPNFGLGPLLEGNQVKRLVTSSVTENPQVQKRYLGGDLELVFVPQGTLAEKFRAQGHGIPAFYTQTGTKTLRESGGYVEKYKKGTQEPEVFSIAKERRNINGKEYLMEKSIQGDVALIKAQKSDTYGNLYFSRAARNFNMDMAQAAKLVIAEVEQIVENGALDPDLVHIPGLFVDRVVQSQSNEKPVQQSLTSVIPQENPHTGALTAAQKKILKRAAKEVKNGTYVNFGSGLPSKLVDFIPSGVKIELLAENGLLGVGSRPFSGLENADVVNANSEPVSILPGTSSFASSLSFGMVRGGYLNLIVVDALQVSGSGDLANWGVPGKQVTGIGATMDIAASGSKIVVATEHTSNGKSKLVGSCNLPISGQGVVKKIITEKAVFKFVDGGFVLTEIASESSLDDIKANTAFEFKVVEKPETF